MAPTMYLIYPAFNLLYEIKKNQNKKSVNKQGRLKKNNGKKITALILLYSDMNLRSKKLFFIFILHVNIYK